MNTLQLVGRFLESLVVKKEKTANSPSRWKSLFQKKEQGIVEEKQIEMFVAGLVLDPATNAPIVVLKDESGDTCLPIWIGMPEATAIASALKQVSLSRPMTHDLLRTTIEQLGGRVARIVITELRESTFIAAIEVIVGESLLQIDARPSDAIALAVRTAAEIWVKAEVLEQARVTLVSIDPEDSEEFELQESDAMDDSQNFSSVDKEKWEQILAEMDPDDFKYKM